MKCGFPKGLKLNAVPIGFIRRSWTLVCKLPEPLLRLRQTGNGKQNIFMPTQIDEIRIHGRPGPHLWGYAHMQERNADAVKGEVRLLDEAGHAAVEILGLRFESLGSDTRPREAVGKKIWTTGYMSFSGSSNSERMKRERRNLPRKPRRRAGLSLPTAAA